MAITKWRPLTEIDDFFRDLSLVGGGETGRDLATDIFQENGNVVVQIQVSGIEPENVEISVENNLLHVSGIREEEYEEEDRDYYSKEILRGSFERVIPLPVSVNEDDASASLENGVLRIVLPTRDKKAKGKEEKKQVGIHRGKKEQVSKQPSKQAKSKKSKPKKVSSAKIKQAVQAPAKKQSKSRKSPRSKS